MNYRSPEKAHLTLSEILQRRLIHSGNENNNARGARLRRPGLRRERAPPQCVPGGALRAAVRPVVHRLHGGAAEPAAGGSLHHAALLAGHPLTPLHSRRRCTGHAGHEAGKRQGCEGDGREAQAEAREKKKAAPARKAATKKAPAPPAPPARGSSASAAGATAGADGRCGRCGVRRCSNAGDQGEAGQEG